MQEAVHNIASNPLPYVLAFVGAFIWAIYATFTPSLSGGYDGTTIFFCCVAVVLWTSISFRETVCRTRRPASVDMLR